jgi:hypothetical protein
MHAHEVNGPFFLTIMLTMVLAVGGLIVLFIWLNRDKGRRPETKAKAPKSNYRRKKNTRKRYR